MKILGLIGTALRLAKQGDSKRPRETDLRRAVSTNYYALFLFLCYLLADLWIGAAPAARDSFAWHQVSRFLQHGKVMEICSNKKKMSRFPEAIRNFAEVFIIAYQNRVKADYDSRARFWRYEVIADIIRAKEAIENFMKVSREERLAFLTLIALPERAN